MKMNKKGFTLIELLAVIVILAIIALIATPIILGIIRDSRDNSGARAVEGYAEAIVAAVTTYQGRHADETITQTDICITGSGCKIGATVADRNQDATANYQPVVYKGSDVTCTGITYDDKGHLGLTGCEVAGNAGVKYTYTASAGAVKD